MINQPTLLKSFTFAFEGIKHGIRENINLKIHFGIALIVFLAAWFLGVSRSDFLFLAIMVIFVIASEMINTSLEEMVDLITTEHRQQAKIAKDVAAGMVFVVSAGAAIIGIIIFAPYVF